MNALFDLSGRVALITGAASGIGKETARVLADLGATVIATDRDHDGVQESIVGVGNQPLALRLDVTLPEDWEAAIAAVTARWKRLAVLVNNAGIMLNCGFMQTALESFRLQQRVNVEGVFLGMHWEPQSDSDGNPLTPEQIGAMFASIIPVGRVGTPNDIAGAGAFLACDASRYMTGSELTVDGGYTVA